ncbi:MAG: type II toxin-antitoxin system Phd/YefM family antitoxin [Pseudonocardia sp.]
MRRLSPSSPSQWVEIEANRSRIVDAVMSPDGGVIFIDREAAGSDRLLRTDFPQRRSLSSVLMSAEDYAALQETAYLLRSPRNARRLLNAYTDAVEGRNLVEHDLAELESPADER